MVSQTPMSTPNPLSETARERSAPTPGQIKVPVEPTPKTHSGSPAPQDQRGGWGGVIALLLVTSMGITGWQYQSIWMPYLEPLLPAKNTQTAKPAARTVPVVTAVTKQRDMDIFLNGLGTVTALNTAIVRSRVEGELIKVAFTEGQLVKEGDLLAEIDPRPFEVQRDQAEGQLARDEATLKVAQLTLERFQKLLPTKTVTQQDVDDQTAIVEQTEGAIKTDKAIVAHAQLQLTYCKIAAPIAGRIGLRLVDQGNIVRANDPTGIAVITQVEPISVVFTIPQDDIYRVQQKMRGGVPLKVDAYDRDFKTRLASGKLLATDNQVDSTTGTLRLKAIFEYDNNSLFPNQFVNTRLLVDTRQNALVVPSAAVQRGPASTFVYLVKADETVEQRTVVIGPTEGAETLIESGLKSGEMVVTEGIDKLQSGAKISLRGNAEKKAAGDGKQSPAKSDRQKDAA